MEIELEFSYLLGPVYRRWAARVNERLRVHGLTRSRWLALWQLSRAPDGLSQQELAYRLSVEAPTVVRLVDALQSASLVERHTCPRDRRAWRIRLTDAAGPLLEIINASVDQVRSELLADINHDDLAVAVSVFRQLHERLNVDEPASAAA